MAFNTAFSAKFTKPLIRQLIAVVQRDIQGALDYISGATGVYQPFLQYELAINQIIQPPTLILAPRNDNILNDAAQQALEQVVTVQAEVWLSNQDPNVLAEQIQDYVSALALIFNNLGASVNGAGGSECDFYTALPINVRGVIDPATNQQITTTTPLALGQVLHCYVTELGFTEMVSHKVAGYMMGGGLVLSVGMIE